MKQKNSVIFSVFGTAAGLLLLFLPGSTVRLFSSAFGLLTVLWGGSRLLRAAAGRAAGIPIPGLLAGILALFIGFRCLTRPESLISLLPAAAGIYILYTGIERISTALRRPAPDGTPTDSLSRRLGISGGVGVVMILAGLALLLFPMRAVTLTLRIVGILLLLTSAGELLHLFRPAAQDPSVGSVRGYARRAPDGAYETEFRDVTDERNREP